MQHPEPAKCTDDCVRRLAATVGLGCLAAAVAGLPAVGGATVCVDDFVWIQIAHHSRSLWHSLLEAWPTHLFFRPIDVAANRLIDPKTLALSPLVVIQMIGLATLSAGVLSLLARFGGRTPRAAFAALAWLWMHPSTQLAVWSAGCSSQTWCAAAGIWGVYVMLNSSCITRSALRLAALSAFGVMAKELFVGWATGLALLAFAVSKGETPAAPCSVAMRRSLPLVLASIMPAALWIAARWSSSSLHDVTSQDAAGLYAIQGPMPILRNTAVAALGMFVQGPVHWARLLGAPWSLVPFVGAAASFLVAWLGASGIRNHGTSVLEKHALISCVGLGLLAVWPALTIEHVSELYLFGPNALIAVLVGLGVEQAFERDGRLHKHWTQICVILLLVITVTGFVSRTRHFFSTWAYARELRQEAWRAVTAVERPEGTVVLIPASLFEGAMHSKYCVAPAVAAALPQAWATMRLGDPSLPAVRFIDGRQSPADSSVSTVTLEAIVPPRELW